MAHRLLTQTVGLSVLPSPIGKIWDAAYALAIRLWGDTEVTSELHGRSVSINFANPYPFAIRRYSNYNAPQVEVIMLTSRALGRQINVVDVGAAIGDTALLILARCSREIASLDCIEGEEEFFRTLERNLKGTMAMVHHASLSDRAELIGTLVGSQGTASAQGLAKVQATTLDCLLLEAAPDVIKVDTDGYDGKVIGGATGLLESSRPSVLFEWHPRLCRDVTETDDSQAFAVLKQAGYTRFVFFTKFGQFSHFGDQQLDQLRELCLTSTTLRDWHYDVVALHSDSSVDEVELADLRNWVRSR